MVLMRELIVILLLSSAVAASGCGGTAGDSTDVPQPSDGAAAIWLLHVVGRRASLKMRFTRRPVCLCCGYDLTGNISGRCPECGRAVDGPIGDEHAGAAAVA
jgi:hypothetical protein